MQIEVGTYGVAFTFPFVMVKAGSTDLAASADWTPAAGDVKVSKDDGNVANITTLPTAVGGTGSVLWKMSLSAAEMQADTIAIQIVDSATKAVEDNAFLVSTALTAQVYGNKGIVVLQVDTGTFTPSDTQFEATRIWPNATEEADADHYLSRNIQWCTGSLTGAMKNVTDYELANSKEKFTTSAFVGAPGSGDICICI